MLVIPDGLVDAYREGVDECDCFATTFRDEVASLQGYGEAWYWFRSEMCSCPARECMRAAFPDVAEPTEEVRNAAVQLMSRKHFRHVVLGWNEYSTRLAELSRHVVEAEGLVERQLRRLGQFLGYPPFAAADDGLDATEEDVKDDLMCVVCRLVRPDPVILVGCRCGQSRGMCRRCTLRNHSRCHVCRQPSAGMADDTLRAHLVAQRHGQALAQQRSMGSSHLRAMTGRSSISCWAK